MADRTALLVRNPIRPGTWCNDPAYPCYRRAGPDALSGSGTCANCGLKAAVIDAVSAEWPALGQ